MRNMDDGEEAGCEKSRHYFSPSVKKCIFLFQVSSAGIRRHLHAAGSEAEGGESNGLEQHAGADGPLRRKTQVISELEND